MPPEVKMVNVMPYWWRWVTLGATFYMNCVVNGYTYCFGFVKISLMMDYPHVSAMLLAIVGGLVPSIYMFAAPVSIAMSKYFGIRYTTMFASALSAACFIGTWANGVFLHWGFIFDLICLGFGQGFAFSLLYGPSVGCLPQYFRIDQLAFAAGVANAGSSVGVIIYGLISNPLFEIYGWRGAMLLYAGISLQGLIAGMILMPKIPIYVKPDPMSIEMVEQQALLPQEPLGKFPPPQAPKVEFLPVVKGYFNPNLFEQWPFICVIGAAGFATIGYFVPTLLLPSHAKSPKYDVSPIVAKNVMAVFGVLNLTGRIVLGKFGDLGMKYAIFSAYWLYIASLVIGAACFLLMPFTMIFGDVVFMGFAIVYGFCSVPIITMRSLVTTTLFGRKNANASYGWFLCAQGGLQIVGYILPAWMDTLGAIYAYAFAALMFLIAAFCCGITFKPYFCERQKQINES